jgi:hypothetical protein
MSCPARDDIRSALRVAQEEIRNSFVAALNTVLLAGLLVAGGVIEPAIGAGGGNWLEKDAALREGKRMDANRMRPASIDCRFDRVSNGSPTYATKIIWKRNKPAVHFNWHVGNATSIAREDAHARKRGFHKVFSKSIHDRASGLHASCVIWEK